VEALNAITTKLRLGQIAEIKHKFEKVIHVGHSFGSVQSYWLSSLYPNNTDGLVLTGWSADGSFIPSTIAGWNLHSARLNQPLRFGDYPNDGLRQPFGRYFSADALIQGVKAILRTIRIQASTSDIWNVLATTEIGDIIYGYNKTVPRLNYPSGYFAHSSLTANQFVFLKYGKYDLGLAVASEQTKQPMTAGELLTIGNAPAQTSFDGPVLVITGDADQPFCGGDCYTTGDDAPSIPAKAEKLFPNASPFEAYIQPQTGHGLNAHYNSTGAYAVILNFLAAHGLAA
jgi:pimeloyl-ACP methyl ester carboxylesterase